jgi:hypothetical protein
MHLIYLDESGNTGNNLSDSEQPIFLLGALIVPEGCWQSLESDLEIDLEHRFPEIAGSAAEVHSSDLRGGRGVFKGVSVPDRIALRDSWLEIALKHELKFVIRSIDKKRFQQWVHKTFGSGISINPYIAAFPLVALVVNEYLAGLPEKALGIFISDENKEIVADVEKSIKQLRLSAGPLRLSQVIEKVFFIDSAKSRILQLCDLCAFQARKKEEIRVKGNAKTFDQGGIALVDRMIHRGNEQIWDVLGWLAEQQKGGAKK